MIDYDKDYSIEELKIIIESIEDNDDRVFFVGEYCERTQLKKDDLKFLENLLISDESEDIKIRILHFFIKLNDKKLENPIKFVLNTYFEITSLAWRELSKNKCMKVAELIKENDFLHLIFKKRDALSKTMYFDERNRSLQSYKSDYFIGLEKNLDFSKLPPSSKFTYIQIREKGRLKENGQYFIPIFRDILIHKEDVGDKVFGDFGGITMDTMVYSCIDFNTFFSIINFLDSFYNLEGEYERIEIKITHRNKEILRTDYAIISIHNCSLIVVLVLKKWDYMETEYQRIAIEQY